MSALDRERVKQLKKKEPSLLGGAMSATVTAGLIGTVAFGMMGISTPGITEGMDTMLGHAPVIPHDVLAAGVKDLLAANVDPASAGKKMGQFGIMLIDKNANMPSGFSHTYDIHPDAMKLLSAQDATRVQGMKLIYNHELLPKPFAGAEIDKYHAADILREKLNTLYNYAGKTTGSYVVGNYSAQIVGAGVGYYAATLAKDKWQARYDAERKKLNPVDRFLV